MFPRMRDKPQDFHYLLARDDAYGNSKPSAFAADVASLVAVIPNKTRKALILVNDSDTTLYICKGPMATLNSGIRLNANGGSYVDTPDSLGYIYRGAYSVITSAAAKILLITEDQ